MSVEASEQGNTLLVLPDDSSNSDLGCCVGETNTQVLANPRLTIETTVDAAELNGVAIGQGEDKRGFELHCTDSQPPLNVSGRVDLKPIQKPISRTALAAVSTTRTAGYRPTGDLVGQSSDRSFKAFSNGEWVTRRVGDQQMFRPSPGLIPTQPIDAPTTRFDSRTAADEGEAPNRFNGQVLACEFETSKEKSEAVSSNQQTTDRQSETKRLQNWSQPLFADPHYNGSCDPEVIWNPVQKEWFIYYTARRATRKKATYVGTTLGVISSSDLINWRFR
ncbi:MAG: hypothetical protein AAF745_14500, partial [Planctomycetota bacterium]